MDVERTCCRNARGRASLQSPQWRAGIGRDTYCEQIRAVLNRNPPYVAHQTAREIRLLRIGLKIDRPIGCDPANLWPDE